MLPGSNQVNASEYRVGGVFHNGEKHVDEHAGDRIRDSSPTTCLRMSFSVDDELTEALAQVRNDAEEDYEYVVAAFEGLDRLKLVCGGGRRQWVVGGRRGR